jgi:pyruvate dehydrogenase E2 component (dihydrolipoamide acetyltransferase)
MELDVIMPKLGLTMEEGILVRWLKKAGEPVKAGEVIFEVETDKSIQEVESPGDGYLSEILVGEGSTVPVAMPVARISSKEESRSPAVPALHELKGPEGEGERLPARNAPAISEPLLSVRDGRIQPQVSKRFVSWRAKKVARELGVDLEELGYGSGPQGRIVERDVREAFARIHEDEEDEWVEFTHVQSITAQRMVQSIREVPHFYLTVDVNAEHILKLRQDLLQQVQEIYGIKLTISDILVKIAALSLLNHPRANASWMDGRLRVKRAINIGLAAASPNGLLVPVIHQADRLTLGEVAQVRSKLTLKVQKGRLDPEDMRAGSFTLSNLGMYGIDQFQAIINPPQSVILAVGRIKERPVGIEGQVVLKPVFTLTLSCDHRVLDGVSGAAFLGDIARLIENPTSIN